MEIEFDADKDAINREKHGISLAEAAYLDWTTVLAKSDRRKDYGEARQIGYGLMGTRLYNVVFVRRRNVFRIISLRKANRREIRGYESEA